ncbi:Rubrerythrin-like protein DVU2318 [Citrifermentans bremense]|uniref:Rubrerythrin n=2 Tax=Geobacteraceae TaxID=213422 RepID=A0ABQ0MJX0_9BACT|nr:MULTISPECIES: rubrerythrin family protein [Geobacteraceae]BCG46136.1 Rubrerythrin-like protein DVU2318 [Citrifermentans bremense]GAW67375.1 rubrerythrin [Geoanaerobacter pelophilus]
MSTKENLAEAFAGESQANRKYLAFAKKAEADGLPQVAKLFRAAAHAETVHAHAHLRAMGGIRSTVENLKEAVEGEGFEFQKMYPPFLEQARAEGDRAAENSFKFALAVEEVHHGLYQQALSAVEAGADLAERPVYVCEVCGNTVYDAAPDKCEVCLVPKERFTLIG